MDRLRTVATFVAGVIVGAGAVYFAPPDPSAGMSGDGVAPGVTGMMPGGDGAMAGGMPGTMPGTMPAGVAGSVPSGAPGSPVPGGVPGATVPGGVPGATVPGGVPGATVPGGVPGATIPGGVPGGPAPEGPPLDDSVTDEVPAAPSNLPTQTGSRLERHLRAATSIWGAVLVAAKAQPSARALVDDVEAHIEALPSVAEHMPPMQDVASYLASSRVLLDRLEAAGVDVTEVSVAIDTLLRPPRGRIPGGPKPGG